MYISLTQTQIPIDEKYIQCNVDRGSEHSVVNISEKCYNFYYYSRVSGAWGRECQL